MVLETAASAPGTSQQLAFAQCSPHVWNWVTRARRTALGATAPLPAPLANVSDPKLLQGTGRKGRGGGLRVLHTGPCLRGWLGLPPRPRASAGRLQLSPSPWRQGSRGRASVLTPALPHADPAPHRGHCGRPPPVQSVGRAEGDEAGHSRPRATALAGARHAHRLASALA